MARFVLRGLLTRQEIQSPLIKEASIRIQLKQDPWQHTEAVPALRKARKIERIKVAE